MKFIRVTKKKPCQVCYKPDFCGVRDDGAIAVCMRVESSKPAKNGGWIHILDDSPIPPKPVRIPRFEAKPSPVQRVRTAEEIDAIYLEFLSQLVITKEHYASLQKRGLDRVDINLHGYKSMPTRVLADIVCKRMTFAGLDLRQVPGFYRNVLGEFSFVNYKNASGYLIPIRNPKGQIAALQLRRDDARTPKYLLVSSKDYPSGATSGTPAHFAALGHVGARADIKEIIITEGALKANIIFELSKIPTAGLVSVTTFNETLPALLKQAFPNLEKVSIAFDMETFDPAKPLTCAFVHVGKQRERLVKTLREADLRTEILAWDKTCKGFDDYLLMQKTQERRAVAA